MNEARLRRLYCFVTIENDARHGGVSKKGEGRHPCQRRPRLAKGKSGRRALRRGALCRAGACLPLRCGEAGSFDHTTARRGYRS